MLSPAFTTARRQAALVIRSATVTFWTSLRTTHRDITTSLGISAAVHLALLLVFGAALYTSGNDDMDVPELSVQLVTREGPSSEEFTEAALPQPVPDPIEDVLNDPGTGEQTVDAPAVADAAPLQDRAPDVSELESLAAFAECPAESRAGHHHRWASLTKWWPPSSNPGSSRKRRCPRPSRSCSARTCSSSPRSCSTRT